MVDLGSGLALKTAIAKLSLFIHDHGEFILDIRNKIENVNTELRWMKSFLRDAENKLDNSHLIQEWVSDVRDVAYDCEDAIDKFLLKLGGTTRGPGCVGAVHRFFKMYARKFPSTYKLGLDIEKINKKIVGIKSRRDEYGLTIIDVPATSDSVNRLLELRRSAPYANEVMVGQEETINLLEEKLTNGGSGRFVISILGMGGLGKTTLARHLYNRLKNKDFKSHGWVCVSQNYNTQDILLSLIRSMCEPTENDLQRMTTTHFMEAYLRDWLSVHPFLVVIDDVWERSAWEILERSFPDNNTSSRVIITTRNRQVAVLNSAFVHEMRHLGEDESWELFCRKAFPYDDSKTCPAHLEQVGKKMVAKCAGLPLAIATLGGVLCTKSQVVSEWEKVMGDLWKELENNSIHINAVLLLSYKDLPEILKTCFLYVGMFPEDFDIEISKLMWMWMAEGFIGAENGCSEDIANAYIMELVDRSLIQITGKDWIEPNCLVHDLLRDLAIQKAREMQFSLYYDGNRDTSAELSSRHRRLVYHTYNDIPNTYDNKSLRTLCKGVSGSHHMLPEKVLQKTFLSFKLLRVVDIQIEGSMANFVGRVLKIDSGIGSLFHLRYLELEVNYPWEIIKVPDTIGNLKALETLSFRSFKPVTLPKTVTKLKKLKHLTGKYDGASDLIGELTSLETLKWVRYEQWVGINTTNLVNLRHLFLTSHPRGGHDHTRFYESIKNLRNLRTLSWDAATGTVSAAEIFKCCPSITHLFLLHMVLNNSQDLDQYALNLEVVELDTVHITKETISSFEKLPRLRALRIKVLYDDTDQLVVSDGGFPQLLSLEIEMIGTPFNWIVRDGGLPSLSHLDVNEPDKFIGSDRMKQLIKKSLSNQSRHVYLFNPYV